MKNDVLVIDAHPDKESYIRVLAEKYYEQSRLAGCNVALVALRDLKFELNLLHGYRKLDISEHTDPSKTDLILLII